MEQIIESLKKQINRDKERNPMSGIHETYSSIPTANDEDWKKYGMDNWTDEDWIRFNVLIDSILTEEEQSTRAVNIIIQRKKYLAEKEGDK